MEWPSAEYAGHSVNPLPVVSCRSPVPSGRIVQMLAAPLARTPIAIRPLLPPG